MSSPNITVIGSYAAGLTMKTDRFPVSGETLLGYDFVCMHGGKGSNQAIACARQGMHVSLIASIGEDSYGRSAINLWQAENICTERVRISRTMPTGVGFILVDGTGSNEIVIDLGANRELDPDYIRQSRDIILSSDVLLMQLEIPVQSVQEAICTTADSHVFTILNPAPFQALPAEVLAGCSLITPNETECRLMLGLPADTEIELDILGDMLLKKGINSAVITLGEKGSYLITPSLRELVPAFTVSSVDTTGAGDTFTAALGSAVAEGASLKEAVLFASAASAIAVKKYGVIDALPTREQTMTFLDAHK